MSAEWVSPRSAELPMAFTKWEFVRGALLTYLFFLGMSSFAWIWTIIGAFMAPVIVAPYGFASLILCGAPLAYLMGMLLRRETRTWVHLCWHGFIGLIAGAFGVFVALCIGTSYGQSFIHLPDWSVLEDSWIYAVVESLVTIFAAMAGWRVTSRWALRSDPWWVDPKAGTVGDEHAEDAATAR